MADYRVSFGANTPVQWIYSFHCVGRIANAVPDMRSIKMFLCQRYFTMVAASVPLLVSTHGLLVRKNKHCETKLVHFKSRIARTAKQNLFAQTARIAAL